MNKYESKYFNTAIKMDEALISLLENKDFEYITVKELCERAGVNRSTFYLHYENTSDLLKETTKYILDKHLSYYSVDIKTINNRFADCELDELIFINEKYLIPYLTFVKDNQRIFKVSVKKLSTLNMDVVYKNMFKHIFSPILFRFKFPENTHSYVMKFYLGGIFGVVMEWLMNDCRDDIDAVARIITDCIIGQVRTNGEG